MVRSLQQPMQSQGQVNLKQSRTGRAFIPCSRLHTPQPSPTQAASRRAQIYGKPFKALMMWKTTLGINREHLAGVAGNGRDWDKGRARGRDRDWDWVGAKLQNASRFANCHKAKSQKGRSTHEQQNTVRLRFLILDSKIPGL